MDQLEKIDSSLANKESKEIKILNLDVSTLLAYVSNMTNGSVNYIYSQPLLTLQAEWERLRPVKPILDELFCDKELLVCRTAYDNFINIVKIIGGSSEVERTNELMKRVEIVDDAVDGRILELEFRGKIKDRSRLVFATGESMKCITVSANEGFVRAARMQVKIKKKIKILERFNCCELIFSFIGLNRALSVQCFCTNRGHSLKEKKRKPKHLIARDWLVTEK